MSLSQSWVHTTNYLSNTKLIAQPITFKGLRTQYYFTAWCWNLLGVSFFLNGIIPIIISYGFLSNSTKNLENQTHQYDDNNLIFWLVYLATITFEATAPMAMLVSTVIKYAIWPKLLHSGGPEKTTQLKTFTNLMEHNANVILVFLEMCYIGNLSIQISHISVSFLLGIIYVLFSYFMASRWIPSEIEKEDKKKNTVQYLYFFLDTTLGMTTSKMLLVLYVIMMMFYTFLWAISIFVVDFDNFWIRLCMFLFLCYVFCRFRD